MEYDLNKEAKRKKHMRRFKKISVWVIGLAVVIFFAFLLVHFSIEKTRMLGNSMDQTLQDNDKIIINKLSYYFTDPDRFDIVVFKQSDNEHSYYNIKRVIGLPGETIQIKDGGIYINDVLLEEPMNTVVMNISGLAAEPLTLEKNEYFVLGDNRNNSEDSRFSNIGTVIRDDIVGKAAVRTEPVFSLIGKLNLKKDEKDAND